MSRILATEICVETLLEGDKHLWKVEVTECDPTIKGSTITTPFKPAILESKSRGEIHSSFFYVNALYTYNLD